ncbi:MAG: rRNA maturation RNase YbeY [Pyrinomonadaceae bacterium]
MIDIVNLQRKVKVSVTSYRAFVQELLLAMPEAKDRVFSVAFIGDNRMKQLNELFRDIDSTTDVLSFPHEPDDFVTASSATKGGQKKLPDTTVDSHKNFLGDIVISVEQAQKQASENGLTLDGEIKQLILHGLLHLCGHDHETDNGEMNARELQLRQELGI